MRCLRNSTARCEIGQCMLGGDQLCPPHFKQLMVYVKAEFMYCRYHIHVSELVLSVTNISQSNLSEINHVITTSYKSITFQVRNHSYMIMPFFC